MKIFPDTLQSRASSSACTSLYRNRVCVSWSGGKGTYSAFPPLATPTEAPALCQPSGGTSSVFILHAAASIDSRKLCEHKGRELHREVEALVAEGIHDWIPPQFIFQVKLKASVGTGSPRKAHHHLQGGRTETELEIIQLTSLYKFVHQSPLSLFFPPRYYSPQQQVHPRTSADETHYTVGALEVRGVEGKQDHNDGALWRHHAACKLFGRPLL